MQLRTLKQSLQMWTDVDGAAYELAVVLGLMDPASHPFHTNAKHVFWSSHPVGEALFQMLESLTKAGVLERRDEPDFQYRWNGGFKGSWE